MQYTQKQLNKILESHKNWLNGENGDRANFYDTDLSDADLSDLDLRKACFNNANLNGVDLSHSFMDNADLMEANLNRAILRNTKLFNADLRYCNMSEADLTNARLNGADLRYIQNKKIITFQFNKDFGWAADGHARIGCIYYSIDTWLEEYEDKGEQYCYTKEEIEAYGEFLKMAKKLCNYNKKSAIDKINLSEG